MRPAPRSGRATARRAVSDAPRSERGPTLACAAMRWPLGGAHDPSLRHERIALPRLPPSGTTDLRSTYAPAFYLTAISAGPVPLVSLEVALWHPLDQMAAFTHRYEYIRRLVDASSRLIRVYVLLSSLSATSRSIYS